MVRDPKMAFSGRYWPKCIQINFISAYYKSSNSLPSETAVVQTQPNVKNIQAKVESLCSVIPGKNFELNIFQ